MRVYICGGPYKQAVGKHGVVVSPGQTRTGYWVQYSYWPEDYGDLPMIGRDEMPIQKQAVNYFEKHSLRFVE